MSAFGLKFRVSVDVWIDVADLSKLSTQGDQHIHIGEADFRNPMSINAVASALKVSVREVRRWIETGDFPPSNLRKGKTHFWTRQAVRSWRKDKLGDPQQRMTKAAGHWADVDKIMTEEEHEWLLKHGNTQKLTREFREMNSLFETDPAAFEKQYPKLKEWLRGLRLRRAILR